MVIDMRIRTSFHTHALVIRCNFVKTVGVNICSVAVFASVDAHPLEEVFEIVTSMGLTAIFLHFQTLTFPTFEFPVAESLVLGGFVAEGLLENCLEVRIHQFYYIDPLKNEPYSLI
jgi:hypothetical protein